MSLTLAILKQLATRSAKFQITTAALSSTDNAAAIATPKTTLSAITTGSWTTRPYATKVKRPGGYEVDAPEQVSTLETDGMHDFVPGTLHKMETVTMEVLLPNSSQPVVAKDFRGMRLIRKNDEGKFDVDYFVGTVTKASVSEIDVEGKKVSRITYEIQPLSAVETDAALAADPSIAQEEGGS